MKRKTTNNFHFLQIYKKGKQMIKIKAIVVEHETIGY